MGNGFVACEVVYCIDSYRIQSPHYHQLCIRHQDWKMVEPQYSVHQYSQFGYNSMVANNPRERVLYAWDNRRLVTYPIIFEEH